MSAGHRVSHKLQQLAFEIADEAARGGIESECMPADDTYPHALWHLPRRNEGRPAWLARDLRYLRARGLAVMATRDIVRLKETASA